MSGVTNPLPFLDFGAEYQALCGYYGKNSFAWCSGAGSAALELFRVAPGSGIHTHSIGLLEDIVRILEGVLDVVQNICVVVLYASAVASESFSVAALES